MIFLFVSFSLFICILDVRAEESQLYAIEGKLIMSLENAPKQIYKDVEIKLGNSNILGFVKEDGSFIVNNISPGSYVLEAIHSSITFEPIRVDVSKNGKIRARRVNHIQPNLVTALPYPLKIKSLFMTPYFQIRERMRITDFLLNPMVLMMILPLIVIMVIPKLMSSMDIDPQKELQQNNNQLSKYDVPDLSEMMTNAFSALTGKSPKKPQSEKGNVLKQFYNDNPYVSNPVGKSGKKRRD